MTILYLECSRKWSFVWPRYQWNGH